MRADKRLDDEEKFLKPPVVRKTCSAASAWDSQMGIGSVTRNFYCCNPIRPLQDVKPVQLARSRHIPLPACFRSDRVEPAHLLILPSRKR
jgi:hypothetical protein